MRIMLDTNVIISLFLFPSEHMNAFKKVLVRHHIVLCSYVVEEIKEVVSRKFPGKTGSLDTFFKELPFEMTYTPQQIDETNYPVLRDACDLPVLVSALIEEIDVLVTGDKDFSDIDIERPEILSPQEFIVKHG